MNLSRGNIVFFAIILIIVLVALLYSEHYIRDFEQKNKENMERLNEQVENRTKQIFQYKNEMKTQCKHLCNANSMIYWKTNTDTSPMVCYCNATGGRIQTFVI